MVILPDVQKSVRTNSAVGATSLSILSLLVPFSLLLLLHWEDTNGLLLADIFFRDDMKTSLWGWNHWLKKTFFCTQCWPRGETEACKAQTDSPAPHVWMNSKHLRQSMHALSYFSKRWRHSFLGKTKLSSSCNCTALSLHDPWMITLEEDMKKSNGRRTIKRVDTNSVWIIYIHPLSVDLLPWAKDQLSLQLVHNPILDYRVLLVVLLL